MIETILILKIALAPALILIASFAGDRWGHIVSGWIISLPLTSAPVIFLLALEHGNDFAAKSAEGTILGFASLSAFSLVYSWLSIRFKISGGYSMVFGWVVFFVFSLIFANVALSLDISFLSVIVWLILINRLFPKTSIIQGQEKSKSSTKGEILTRMIATVSLIFIITEEAPLLGPKLSGLLTPFPIYTSVLVASIYRREGVNSAFQFVRGATVGLFTPTAFFLIVGNLIIGWGVGLAYVSAIAVSVIVHVIVLKSLRQE